LTDTGCWSLERREETKKKKKKKKKRERKGLFPLDWSNHISSKSIHYGVPDFRNTKIFRSDCFQLLPRF